MAGQKCHYEGCNSKRGILDGFCRVHHWRADPPKSPPNQGVKNKELSKQLEAMLTVINGLQRETLELNNQLSAQDEKMKKLEIENHELKIENGDLKQRVNLNFLATVAQNQYGRKECANLNNKPEASERKQDNKVAVEAVIEAAAKIGVDVCEEDIQRCHRVGKYREGKIRPIICKFRWYKKRMDFLTKKAKLKPDTKDLTIDQRKKLLKNSLFITENLCPYRGKVLRFIRDYNREHKLFEIVTTHNGLISCKKKIDDPEWINISSSLDFHDLCIPREKYENEFRELFF